MGNFLIHFGVRWYSLPLMELRLSKCSHLGPRKVRFPRGMKVWVPLLDKPPRFASDSRGRRECRTDSGERKG